MIGCSRDATHRNVDGLNCSLRLILVQITMFKHVTVFAVRRKRPAASVIRPHAEYETSLPPAINRIVRPPHSSIPIGHL